MPQRALRATAARRVTARATPRGDRWLPLLLHGAFRLVSVVALPFVLLVRGSVLLYENGVPTWIALVLAAVVALGVITLYGVWLVNRVTGHPRHGLVLKWIALPLVVGYCGYALLFLARSNAKNESVRTAYVATHPLLRIALTTVILAEGDIVVTDLSRTPDDYRRMGLAVREASLHYRQRDGWVHAVDLRTSGRGAIGNFFLWLYFEAMGFNTLRHGGTADHLHVSLPVAR